MEEIAGSALAGLVARFDGNLYFGRFEHGFIERYLEHLDVRANTGSVDGRQKESDGEVEGNFWLYPSFPTNELRS